MSAETDSLTGADVRSALVEDHASLTFRVHRSAYRSQEVFERERDMIWQRSWLYLGHETEIRRPGDFVTRKLGGRPLIFCRDSQGDVRVYLNACPHRGTILCRETGGNSERFQCFYHAWTFNNTGDIASIPDSGAYADIEAMREAMRLRELPRMQIHEGFVFVAFTDQVPDLLTHLGKAADFMTRTSQIGPQGMEVAPGGQFYGVRGNWKLGVENAMDGYHFAPTHQTFVGYLRTTGFKVTDDDQYAYDLGNGHCLLVLTGHNGRIGMVWEPRFGEVEKERIEQRRVELEQRLGAERATEVADESKILYVFPNLLLFDLEACNIRQLEPVSADRTDLRAWQLVEVGESQEARKLRLQTMVSFVGPGGLATPDDIEAYEAVQRGIEATAGMGGPALDWNDMSRGMSDEVAGRQGRSIDEGAMRSFWRHWRDTVAGATEGSNG